METRRLATAARALTVRLTRRRVLTAAVGSGAALGPIRPHHADAQGATPVAGNPAAPIPVNLVAKLAGEDLTRDWLRVVPETDLLTTATHPNVTVDPGATAYSDPVDCARHRTCAAFAVGAAGPITFRIELSPDDGATWFWHPNGESPPSQYPAAQFGPLVAPRCRLAVTNRDPRPQSVNAWLVLAR